MKTYVNVLLLSILCSSAAYAEVSAGASPQRWVAEVMAAPSQSVSKTAPSGNATSAVPTKELLKAMVRPNG